MNIYTSLRSLLFKMDAETAHHGALKILRYGYLPSLAAAYVQRLPQHRVRIANLDFPNPVGLAAGFDNNGDAINGLFGLGFGFIELGAITPQPQAGNPKPRLWRLPQASALINCMGFPNKGVHYLVENLKREHLPGIIGVNLGKNAHTPLDCAYKDYCYSLEYVFPYADFVTLNISSPNTSGLRELQREAYLNELLTHVCEVRDRLQHQSEKVMPLFIKLSVDTPAEMLPVLCQTFLHYQISGIITSNTTLSRRDVEHLPNAQQKGGLSGRPLFQSSTQMIADIRKLVGKQLAIIGLGGIFSAEDALQKLSAGADLVQIYSGLIYQGPKLISDILQALKNNLEI